MRVRVLSHYLIYLIFFLIAIVSYETFLMNINKNKIVYEKKKIVCTSVSDKRLSALKAICDSSDIVKEVTIVKASDKRKDFMNLKKGKYSKKILENVAVRGRIEISLKYPEAIKTGVSYFILSLNLSEDDNLYWDSIPFNIEKEKFFLYNKILKYTILSVLILSHLWIIWKRISFEKFTNNEWVVKKRVGREINRNGVFWSEVFLVLLIILAISASYFFFRIKSFSFQMIEFQFIVLLTLCLFISNFIVRLFIKKLQWK